jgi:hypothetical protein
MDDADAAQKRQDGDRMPAMRMQWRLRFSPHVLVLLVTLWAAVPPLRGTIVSAVYWWWDESYAQVEFVMDEARPNDGAPYIAGHLARSGEPYHLLGEMKGETMVVRNLPHEPFAPGKRIAIWHSAGAPNFLAFGAEVNGVPVAGLPQRPGLPALLGYLAWLVATLAVGFKLTAWVFRRWSRSHGELALRPRAGTTSKA